VSLSQVLFRIDNVEFRIINNTNEYARAKVLALKINM